MYTTDIKTLMAEMAERRKLHQENFREVQRSLFKFRTGLQMVKVNLEQTTESFFGLIGVPLQKVNLEPQVVELRRKAS